MANETEDERRARLLAEAAELKAPIDQAWSTDQIEKAVEKRRPKAAPTPPPAPVVSAREKELEALLAEAGDELSIARENLKVREAANAELVDQVLAANKEVEDLKAKLSAKTAEALALESQLSDAKVALFDAEAAKKGIKDNPTPSNMNADEDAAVEGSDGKTAPAVAKPKRKGQVQCTITKAGDGKVSDGNGGFFKRGDKIMLEADTAASLEEKNFAETD